MGFKDGKPLCGLESSRSLLQVAWTNGATAFTLDDQLCLLDSMLECC